MNHQNVSKCQINPEISQSTIYTHSNGSIIYTLQISTTKKGVKEKAMRTGRDPRAASGQPLAATARLCRGAGGAMDFQRRLGPVATGKVL